MPEFDGSIENYVSWRQSAHTAYKVFKRYTGSSKHYQALAIIRNKIRGSADGVLASFNTVLNFDAIISRLDFTYSDKRPTYLIEQELSTLRQGNKTVVEYYQEVEKKLTALTNKTLMSYKEDLALAINQKYRDDALRIFVSGLKKSMSDVLFSARPADLPSALALAQEIEANHERYAFAASFSRRNEEKQNSGNILNTNSTFRYTNSNVANFRSRNFYNRNSKFPQSYAENQSKVEPMDIDPSISKFRQPNVRYERNSGRKQFFQNRNQNSNDLMDVDPTSSRFKSNLNSRKFNKRFESDRQAGSYSQRINHIRQEPDTREIDEYQSTDQTELDQMYGDQFHSDGINFLDQDRNYRI